MSKSKCYIISVLGIRNLLSWLFNTTKGREVAIFLFWVVTGLPQQAFVVNAGKGSLPGICPTWDFRAPFPPMLATSPSYSLFSALTHNRSVSKIAQHLLHPDSLLCRRSFFLPVFFFDRRRRCKQTSTFPQGGALGFLATRFRDTGWVGVVCLVGDDGEALRCLVVDDNPTSFDHVLQTPLLGWVMAIVMALLSGFAGVYTEAIIKKQPSRNINVQNFWLYVFGMVFNAAAIVIQDFNAVVNKDSSMDTHL